MARKKSAAKKARESELKAKVEETTAREEAVAKKQISDDESDQYSSSSEEEDENGELINDNVDAGINQVLKALKEDPSKLLDKNVKFFEDDGPEGSNSKSNEKPIYLKDYHRMNLLSGGYEDDEAEGTVDGEKSYVTTQREERTELLEDIKNAFNEDESDDEFLTKKEKKHEEKEPAVKLPNPEANSDGFLQAFLDQKAWIPTKNDKVIDLDKIDNDDDEDFEDAVEQFEKAYNFRYEDANAAEIVSYARTQATLRRDKTNSRKRQREKLAEEKEQKVKAKEEKLKKKETSKLNLAVDRLAKIKEAVGDDIDESIIQKVFGDSLLNDDFDDADWDGKMAEIFNEQYYNEDVKKPKFSDMEDFDEEEEDQNDEEQNDEEQNDEPESSEEPEKKRSKKDKLKKKKEAKKEKASLKEKAKKIVEANRTKLVEEVEDEMRGRSQEEDVKFKYREVSPETYGLNTRDILIADDQQLNSYIGIKKFAPYRPKELRTKDRRKYKKKRLIQEWRKEVFRKYKPKEEGDEDTIWIPAKKHKKHTKN